MRKRKVKPLEVVNLDPEGAGNIITGMVGLLLRAGETCDLLLRGMESMKDRGVRLIIDPAKGDDSDAVREYDDIMQILTLMRNNIPRKVYDLVAINQIVNVSEGGKPN